MQALRFIVSLLLLQPPSMEGSVDGGDEREHQVQVAEYHDRALRFGKPKHMRPKVKSTKELKEKRIIYFLHLHKAGGTTMCVMAVQNGQRASQRTNCNVQKDQRCCGGNDSIEAQRQFAERIKFNFNFVASEKPMYEGMDLAYYRYIVTLRNSKSRYVSHWSHIRRVYEKEQITFVKWQEGQADNYNLRMLCGTRCMNTTKFQLTRDDYEYAVGRLHLFENVLFVEDFANSFAQLAKDVGWSVKPSLGKTKLKARPNDKNKMTVDDVTIDPLMTALDDALYFYAWNNSPLHEGLQHKEDEEMVKKRMNVYFEEGKSRNCANPCCGKCSIYR